MTEAGPRRLPAVVAIAGLLILAAAVERRAGPSREATPRPAGVLAPPASATSTAWYCTGATAQAKGGPADGTLVVANLGRRRLTGQVTVFPSQGQARSVPLGVDPSTRALVRLGDVTAAPFASATVELDGGQVVVEQVVRGPAGESVAPCATAPSPTWYFADGATSKDASETLSVFNPFPEDALVDLSFSTEEGRTTPQDLTGVAVPGGSMLAVNVGDHVHRRDAVSTEVRARVGRLVVDRLQGFDGSAGRKGLSLALGLPALGPIWYLPEGLVADGLTERYHVFNPTDREQHVEVALSLESGDAEPMELTVPPEARVTVEANAESRIPKNVPHAVVVRAPDGPGVVVERTVESKPPSPRLGLAITPAAPALARRWGFAAGSPDSAVEEWVVFQNPGPRPARVSVTGLADGQPVPVSGLQDVSVGAGRRMGVRVDNLLPRPGTPVVVTATVPIVVERDLYRTKALGTAMVTGIPLLP